MSLQLGTFVFSALVSLVVVYLLYHLLARGFVHVYRPWGPAEHLQKRALPTGGGLVFIIILVALEAVGILWADALFTPDSSYIEPSLMLGALALSLALLGFVDDWLKVRSQSSTGLLARYKLAIQLVLVVLFLWQVYPFVPETLVPFSSDSLHLPLWAFLVLGTVFMLGMVNGMNFADGLDGLAVGMALIMLGSLVAIFNLARMSTAANPLGNMLLFSSVVMAGAALAFLVANFRPAFIYMGDTGSYFLGAFIGGVAVISGALLYLIIIGALLGMEILSVVLQVAYFRLTGGKRILKMSPLHHHFELSGMSELGVVFMFWGVQAVLSALAVLGFFISTL